MSDIDDVIDTLDSLNHGSVVAGMISRARAELAQLRATVAEQARQVEEARKAFHDYELPEDTISFALRELACIIPADEMSWHTWLLRQADTIDAWLAANAPAPQAEQEQTK